jgi:hypothetical protein
MKPTYKIIEMPEYSYIEKTEADGKVWSIPMDETNSDYQAYLNKDKAEQSTPSVIDEAEAK